MPRPPSLPYQSAADERAESAPGRWFSLTPLELAVVIGVIALLIVILLPLFDRGQRFSPEAHCMANLRQIGMSALLYENDFPGHVPRSLDEVVFNYADTPQSGSELVICPNDPKAKPASGPFILDKNASYAYHTPAAKLLSPTTRPGNPLALSPATIVVAHCFP